MNIPIEGFEDYLKNKGLKPRSIENYLYYFSKFSYPLFNQDTASRFLSKKENRNTIGRAFLLNYRKFLLLNHRELNISPEIKAQISEVELPKITGRSKMRIPRPIPHEQIFVLEEHLEEERFKLLLLMTYFCGLRLGEAVRIRINSFAWQNWGANEEQMGECRVYGKGDKEGIALVPSNLMKRIRNYIHRQEFMHGISAYLFADPYKKNPSTKGLSRSWQQKLSEAAIKAKITQIGEDGQPIKETIVHPHRLRHSYGTYLITELDMDIRKVQELLRHSSITSTQIYTHISKKHLVKGLSGLYKEEKKP